MRNYLQDGEVMPWTNGTGSAVSAGGVVAVGLMAMAVAAVDIASTATGSVQMEGVFTLTKTTGAIVQGGKVWWDPVNLYVINAPTKNCYFLGYAFRAAASDATTVDVQLECFCDEGPRLLTLAATGNESLTAADFMSGDLTLVVPNTGAKTIALPAVAAVPVGAILRVKKTTADAQAVTLDGNSSETVGGGATYTSIDANGDTALFANTGTAWQLIDSTIA